MRARSDAPIESGVTARGTNSRYNRKPRAVSATQYCAYAFVTFVGVADAVAEAIEERDREWVGAGDGEELQPVKSNNAAATMENVDLFTGSIYRLYFQVKNQSSM